MKLENLLNPAVEGDAALEIWGLLVVVVLYYGDTVGHLYFIFSVVGGKENTAIIETKVARILIFFSLKIHK